MVVSSVCNKQTSRPAGGFVIILDRYYYYQVGKKVGVRASNLSEEIIISRETTPSNCRERFVAWIRHNSARVD